jgi:hypothetical protein
MERPILHIKNLFPGISALFSRIEVIPDRPGYEEVQWKGTGF